MSVSATEDVVVGGVDHEDIEMPKKKKRMPSPVLKKYLNLDETVVEIGVDEVGRGPLFGRVYAAAVILPKDDSFNHSLMKDSKRFHSKKKIDEAAEYIKEHALAWHVDFVDEKHIDKINILQATQQSMHAAIYEVRKQFNRTQLALDKIERKDFGYNLLIDGSYFNPFNVVNKQTQLIETVPHTTVPGGDNEYSAIAAASILAKVERDKYIDDLCEKHPLLVEHYDIASNKGYGTKKHLDGIKQHGITDWHRKSFGICKRHFGEITSAQIEPQEDAQVDAQVDQQIEPQVDQQIEPQDDAQVDQQIEPHVEPQVASKKHKKQDVVQAFVVEFVSEKLQLAEVPVFRIKKTDLYAAFNLWLEKSGKSVNGSGTMKLLYEHVAAEFGTTSAGWLKATMVYTENPVCSTADISTDADVDMDVA
jgi:ribonuclease HII